MKIPHLTAGPSSQPWIRRITLAVASVNARGVVPVMPHRIAQASSLGRDFFPVPDAALVRRLGQTVPTRPRRLRWITLLTVAGLAAVGLPAFNGGAPAAALSRDYFAVPQAALARSLGEVAHGSCAPPPAWQACQGDATPVESPSGIGSIPGNYPMGVPGLGIPVGGIGSGSFMINQDGTFGPWNFGGAQGSTYETRILPQAAFHFREQLGSGPATVRTLATDGPTNVGVNGKVSARSWGSPLPAWNALNPGDGTTSALYPFGWESFTPFQTDVSLRYFSPIVAGEDRRSSLPLVYFDVRIANHASQAADVSVMFTMPNAPDHIPGTKGDPSSPDGPPSVRTGYTSSYKHTDGVQAITLSANSPTNTPDAANSEWTIAAAPAAGQKVSYSTSWNADGDGSDIYAPFVASGSLPNTSIDSSDSAGAISVSAKLQPGEVTTVPFALAWDFPQVGFDNNQTTWMRRYTNFYGAKETATNDYVAGSYPGHQSYAIAHDGLVAHDTNLSAVQNWWKPIAMNPAYPDVLKLAALNQIGTLVFNNSFWEGGLVSNSVVPTGFNSTGPGQHLDADRPGSHLFGIMIAGGGGVSNEGWTDGLPPRGPDLYFKLFPNLMKDMLEATADTAQKTKYGNTSSSLYSPNADPFITWADGTASQGAIQNGTAQPIPGETQWLEGPSDYNVEAYEYYHATGDATFLRTVYPAIKANIAYLQQTIPAGTYLPFDAPAFDNYLDAIPQGNVGVINSELYLLSLEIGIRSGTVLNDDPNYVLGLRTDLARAKAEFETVLWNPAQQYYRFNAAGPNGDAAFNQAFGAQHLATALGLDALVDPTHHIAEAESTYSQFLRHDAAGRLTGAIVLEQPAGAESPAGNFPPQASTVEIASNYLMAADLYATGARYNLPQLKAHALEMATAVASVTWLDDSNGFQFDGPEDYVGTDPSVYTYPGSAMASASIDLLDAIDPIRQYQPTSG